MKYHMKICICFIGFDMRIGPSIPPSKSISFSLSKGTCLVSWETYNLSSGCYLVAFYPLGPLLEKGWNVITAAEGMCHDNSCLSRLWHFHVDRGLSQVLLYSNCLFRFPWNICTSLLLPTCCFLRSTQHEIEQNSNSLIMSLKIFLLES